MNEKNQNDENLALVLRALGHPVRLNILRVIAKECKNQCCCTDVTKCFDLAQSTISQHIKVLFNAGLISKTSKGTRNCYVIYNEKFKIMKKTYDDYLASLDIKDKK